MEERFQQPADFEWGMFKNAAGRAIRYGHVTPLDSPRARIVILPGFREPAEKYFEVMREKLAQGYEIFVMDWPGQGGSDHFLPDHPMKAHHVGYDENIATLDQFMRQIVPVSETPLFIFAHSMGGHMALRYLRECTHNVCGAALTNPMFGIQTGMPNGIARSAAHIAQFMGLSEHYAPGEGDWAEAGDVFADNKKTSDPVRFNLQNDLYRNNPRLRMGGPTVGWVYQTFRSLDILNEENYLASISTPLLIGISGGERIVDNKAATRALGFLKNGTRVDVPRAQHELWMEQDALREQWLRRVDDFLRPFLL